VQGKKDAENPVRKNKVLITAHQKRSDRRKGYTEEFCSRRLERNRRGNKGGGGGGGGGVSWGTDRGPCPIVGVGQANKE